MDLLAGMLCSRLHEFVKKENGSCVASVSFSFFLFRLFLKDFVFSIFWFRTTFPIKRKDTLDWCIRCVWANDAEMLSPKFNEHTM